MPDELANDNEVPIHQGHWVSIRRLRAEGGRAYLGRSAVYLGIETEDRAIGPDRAAEVSRGRIRHESAEGPNGPRKGLMGEASWQRNS